MITVHLLRHGETIWHAENRYAGVSDVALTAESRQKFADSCVDLFLRKYPGVFDGLDIDWEYPVCCGEPGNVYRPEDRANATKLFRTLRLALVRAGLEGAPWGRERGPFAT